MKKGIIILALAVTMIFSCSKSEVAEPTLTPPTTTASPTITPPPPTSSTTTSTTSTSTTSTSTTTTSGFVACTGGKAGVYPCLGYDLYAHIPLTTMEAKMANDSWGWTDPQTQKEYAIMGVDDGTVFVDISTPDKPIYLGKLPTATVASSWRDVKVYKNYAFIVSEAKDHGLQIFDLTNLRGVTSKQTFTVTKELKDFGRAHNIAVNETSGYAYVIGSSLQKGGPVFINIQDPINPKIEGGFADEGYTHDAQIVTYKGPDADYQSKEIFIGSNSIDGLNNQMVIVDVTDKAAPKLISQATYSNGGYTHQGWLDENHRYFYLGDELDEEKLGNNTKTLVFDLTDLDKPLLHYTYLGPTAAIDHNGYTKGNSLFLANYTAGFREIDIQNIGSKEMKEIAFFDTFPANDATSFGGVWNVYPYFESGIILISDSNSGLFLVKASK